jgi:hypothetical protein
MRSSCRYTLRDQQHVDNDAVIALGDTVEEQVTIDHLESSPQANASKWARATETSGSASYE